MIHPRFRTLSGFAYQELLPNASARVARHLLKCKRCRAMVDELRGVRAGTELLRTHVAPTDIIDKVIEAREQGRRVLLPDAHVAADASRGATTRTAMRVAAVLLVLITALLLVPRTRNLSANASRLVLNPEAPEQGASISAEYHATSTLAKEARLVLRARFRRPADDESNRALFATTAAILERGEDGVFRGRFRLPDSVVFAAFAVENEDASHVDTNARKAWELLVHANGNPTFDALVRRANDHMGRSWEEAHETARLATTLYPDNADGWQMLNFFDQAVLGANAQDSLRTFHSAIFRRLDAKYANAPDPDGALTGAMMWYSYSFGDSIRTRFWESRLEREHPAHPYAVQNRIVKKIRRPNRGNSQKILALAEDLWKEVGYRHSNQLNVGRQEATAANDAAEIRKWWLRHVTQFPASKGEAGAAFVEVPALRSEGMSLLRERLQELDSAHLTTRGLFATRSEQRTENMREQATLLGALGRALQQEGHTAAALDTFDLAVERTWDPTLFGDVARARLAAGDTSGAVEMTARVIADPGTSPTIADSLRARFRTTSAEWLRAETDATDALERMTLMRGIMRRLPKSVPVQNAQGEAADLREELGSAVGVVVYWSPYCGPALSALSRIQAVATQLKKQGAIPILVVEEKPSQKLRDLLRANNVDMVVLHDVQGGVRRSLAQFGTPSFFVIDRKGHVRFEYSELSDVIRQAKVLQTET